MQLLLLDAAGDAGVLDLQVLPQGTAWHNRRGSKGHKQMLAVWL